MSRSTVLNCRSKFVCRLIFHRIGYALYSSSGSLDMQCTDKLTIGNLKDMLCVPIILLLRGELRSVLDKVWVQLSGSQDSYCIQYAAKARQSMSSTDPDDLRINFKIFEKILDETDFSRYMRTSTVFGRKGTCRR